MAIRLMDEVFLRYSVPEQLHSDQSHQFKSELLMEICKLLNIRKTRTTPYHPQCDGLRLESIMLQNLPIMLFGISPIFCLLCLFLCFSEMHYAFILCVYSFVQERSSCDTM